MASRIGYIVGSTSSDSINRKLVAGIIELAGERDAGEALSFHELPINALPMYDRDLDEQYPDEAVALKNAVLACDGLLIATPEYNRSIPGALKNALDWISRPYGDNALRGKPVAIVGASVGASGTAMAQQHLRNILAYLDAPTLGQPEVYIQFSSDRFDDDGTIVDPSTREFLGGWLDAYRAWVQQFDDTE